MQVGPQVLGVVAVGPGRCQVGPQLTIRDLGVVVGAGKCLLVEPLKNCLASLTGQAAELENSQLVMKHSELVLENLLDVGFGTH